MGSVGKNNSTEVSKPTFVDKDVTSLSALFERGENENYTQLENRVRETLNIPGASEKQIDVLRQIFRGIDEYDKGYDDNKTPYRIVRFTVREMKSTSTLTDEERRQLRINKTKNPIYLSISTEPNSDSAMIRMLDSKQRLAVIGPNGGLFMYDDKGNKKSLKLFDVQYGKKG